MSFDISDTLDNWKKRRYTFGFLSRVILKIWTERESEIPPTVKTSSLAVLEVIKFLKRAAELTNVEGFDWVENQPYGAHIKDVNVVVKIASDLSDWIQATGELEPRALKIPELDEPLAFVAHQAKDLLDQELSDAYYSLRLLQEALDYILGDSSDYRLARAFGRLSTTELLEIEAFYRVHDRADGRYIPEGVIEAFTTVWLLGERAFSFELLDAMLQT